MKYLILMYGSQQDYDGMAGRAGGGQPAWSPADFAAMGAFMESFGQDRPNPANWWTRRA
jgi:hypothetical protein